MILSTLRLLISVPDACSTDACAAASKYSLGDGYFFFLCTGLIERFSKVHGSTWEWRTWEYLGVEYMGVEYMGVEYLGVHGST